MKIIKILWVDDKFQDPNDSFTKKVDSDIQECQDKDNTIVVIKLSNREDFLKELSLNNNKYAAIILDGEVPDKRNDTPETKNFDLYLRPIDRLNYKVLKYVYSSYPDQVEKMATEYGFEIRDKSDIEPYDLLVEIKDCLALEFPIAPELIMSIRENFISRTNNGYMRNIIDSYYDPNNAPLDDMRFVLEEICDKIIGLGVIPATSVYPNANLRGKVEALLHFDKSSKITTIPYNVCPIEIQHAIRCVEQCSQTYSHFQGTIAGRMNSTIYQNYENYYKDMAYNAFFLIVKWYYGFMLNERNYPSNGIYTDKNKIYYI